MDETSLRAVGSVGWCMYREIKYKVMSWNSRWRRPMVLTRSDIIALFTSFHIRSQWHFCSAFKYSASACCSSCNVLQNPPPPSAPPVQICNRVISCMLYIGIVSYMIYSLSHMLTAACLWIFGSSKSLFLLCCICLADIFHKDQTY